ncbi:hypothetical protein QVD17_00382 [Tagetes erecta]|uniref:Uncharacterized protein n=1 Tax=Tagetes erecta TaxID=13708 RepID=A0AAD8L7R3_TARER|nr:hypothetical protein QVD17_00382 [Tagetes erecta]
MMIIDNHHGDNLPEFKKQIVLFGVACKFHHPQPALDGPIPPVSGPLPYAPVGSPARINGWPAWLYLSQGRSPSLYIFYGEKKHLNRKRIWSSRVLNYNVNGKGFYEGDKVRKERIEEVKIMINLWSSFLNVLVSFV